MPIYEYRCDDCARTSETLQRLGDPPLAECPHCGGRVRKLISAPSFQFKGSGWYATDYAKKTGGADKGDAGDAAKGDSGGGDSKGGDSKGGETKGGDSKGGETKSGEGEKTAASSTAKPSSDD